MRGQNSFTARLVELVSKINFRRRLLVLSSRDKDKYCIVSDIYVLCTNYEECYGKDAVSIIKVYLTYFTIIHSTLF